jgi:hypothetical protein
VKHSFAPLEPDAVDYLSRHTGVDYHYGTFEPPNWLCVSCRDDEGRLMGLCVFEFKTWFDAQFSIAVTDPRCITRRVMRAMFTAVFSQAVRVTAYVDVENRRALRQMKTLGFVYEGFCRRGINGVRDAYTFGMLREDCRYLPGYRGGTTITMEFDDGERPQAS